MAEALIGTYFVGSLITGTTMNQSLVHGYLVGSVAAPAIIAAGKLAIPVLKVSGQVVGGLLSGAGSVVSNVLSKLTPEKSFSVIYTTMLAEVIPEKDQADDVVEDDWILVNS
jgi:hypothetical protein